MRVRYAVLGLLVFGSMARAQNDGLPLVPANDTESADDSTSASADEAADAENAADPLGPASATPDATDLDATDLDATETGTAPTAVPPGAASTTESAQSTPGVRVMQNVDEDDETPHGFVSGNRRHARMAAIRVGAGFGYLFAIKYTSGSPCESADPTMEPASFCNGLTEPFLDLELSYSPTHKLEIGAYVMLALSENDAALAKPRIFGVGIRGYTAEENLLKGYFGARVLLDLTKSDVATFNDFDFGIRGEFGIQIEPVRWLGIWLGGAVAIQFLRNFTFIPQVNGGLQVRFP